MAANNDLFLIGNDLYIDPFAGDFIIEVSDSQHVQDTITAYPGWWKESPADGVGIFGYQNSSGKQQVLSSSIKKQLQSDGYQCNNPIITQGANGLLKVQPNAIKV